MGTSCATARRRVGLARVTAGAAISWSKLGSERRARQQRQQKQRQQRHQCRVV